MKLLRTRYHGLFWGSLLLLAATMVGCRGAEGPPPTSPSDEQEQAAPVAPEEAVTIAPEPAAAPSPEETPAVSPNTAAETETPVDPTPAEESAAADAPPAAQSESEGMAADFPKPPEVDDTWQMPEPEPWNLGPPLVENVDRLKPLDPKKPVWVDMENKRVVLVGKVCQREVPLELFACLRYTKEHEAIVVFDVKALSVHAGLLAVGAEAGNPVQFNPEYVPARGTEIEVTVRWKDADGKVQTARAQDWIQNIKTNKAMAEKWVFAGSGFWVEGGQKTYQAEGGDFICVANFATAMLDIPVESSQANQMLTYRAFTEHIPPLETPVTLLLTPKIAANEPK